MTSTGEYLFDVVQSQTCQYQLYHQHFTHQVDRSAQEWAIQELQLYDHEITTSVALLIHGILYGILISEAPHNHNSQNELYQPNA